jgi:GDPmannose 4,6-dehydratase
MKSKVAFITGVTGQDGSYLAELLLKKKYVVHAIKRRSSSINTERIDSFFKNKNFHLHYGDLSDFAVLLKLINKTKPDEIYNLGAQSHVSVSFDKPVYTADINAIGTLRILEIVRTLKLNNKTKIYQAGTSEMFGKTTTIKQSERTKFYPRSPYAVSKLFSHWICINYREAHGIHVSNGILFNHESPRRGETFVTRKISIGLAKIKLGLEKNLEIGNLNAKRDWGHARDYVYMQWLILQQKKPNDYVIATGRQHSVRDFINEACKVLKININWKNKGINEKGYDDNGKCIIKVSKKYFRPTEVDSLLGDFNKAKKILKWKPKTNFKQLVKEMVESDLKKLS